MEKSPKLKQESDSPLDTLRIEKTGLTQDEFAHRCGIPRATYYRWITGRTEAKLTIPQIKKLCRLLNMNLEDLPDNLGPEDKP
ncbi:MAG: helix-turn-helix transcriptional regulator [Dolichospermum sp. JUN01]|nr:helix-turn-helix transcriptional regulator [Dolichospermum sp. JUN01]QSV53105.1 MAG: helix-turn-helix transcriptional regulator [Dolichospermum sp. UKL201]